MFGNLTDFAYKRSGKEAFGFYLAYLVLIIVSAGLLGGVIGLVMGEEGIAVGMRVGNLIAVFMCLAVSFVLLSKKKLTGNFGLILLALLSGVLAFLGGGILGLIPAAYITTK